MIDLLENGTCSGQQGQTVFESPSRHGERLTESQNTLVRDVNVWKTKQLNVVTSALHWDNESV